MKLTMVVERFVHNYYFTLVEFQALRFFDIKEGEL